MIYHPSLDWLRIGWDSPVCNSNRWTGSYSLWTSIFYIFPSQLNSLHYKNKKISLLSVYEVTHFHWRTQSIAFPHIFSTSHSSGRDCCFRRCCWRRRCGQKLTCKLWLSLYLNKMWLKFELTLSWLLSWNFELSWLWVEFKFKFQLNWVHIFGTISYLNITNKKLCQLCHKPYSFLVQKYCAELEVWGTIPLKEIRIIYISFLVKPVLYGHFIHV